MQAIRRWWLPAGTGALASLHAYSCSGIQSTLSPAGRDAERIAQITIWMSAAFVIIWLAVIALAVYAPRATPSERAPRFLIIGGGVAFPLVVLTILLFTGLSSLPAVLAPGPEGAMQIEVTGNQWWWRVKYHLPGGETFETANEVRLPVGARVTVNVSSNDVIHSFWIPSLTGKMDMIPGRVNRIALEPTRAGVFRGSCAEFCGEGHALMSLFAVVTAQQEFDRWAAVQRSPARAATGDAALRGEREFFARGCSNCHSVRGTAAHGIVGPDLTHVASRHSIAAGVLAARPDDVRKWIAHTQKIKPGSRMPAFDHLPPDTLHAIAAYLEQLR